MTAAWGDGPPTPHSWTLSRRARTVLVVLEGTAAAVLGGVAIGGGTGWTIAALAVVLFVVLFVLWRGGGSRRRAPQRAATESSAFIADLRVLGVTSRSSGEVGVIGDGQGFAAGMELDVKKGAILDIDWLCRAAAGDPSRPSSVQVRLTEYAPPAGGWLPGATRPRRRGASASVHRRVHVLLRFEPMRARDVVDGHGGGAQGSRFALVASVDRLSARLRRRGIANRVLDTAMLNDLLAEDCSPTMLSTVLAADPGSQADIDRLLQALEWASPERAVLSLCVDVASSDQWQSFAAIQVAARDREQRDGASAALLADAAVRGVASREAMAAIVPLGGGPGALESVLTLART